MISEDKRENIFLPRLNRLRWLSIDGCPPDGYLLKEILSVSPNLSMLILDMKFLLQLIDDQSCISLLKTRTKHLSIQVSDETELDDIHIEKLSFIFTHVRHMIIESKISTNICVEKIILSFLHYFKNHPLISIVIRSSTSEQLRDNPTQWLIDHTYLNEYIDRFKTECDEIEFKIWL